MVLRFVVETLKQVINSNLILLYSAFTEPDARLIITAVSDSGTMLIYNMTQLIWAAQLPDVPIAICRSNLDCLAGAIVMLFENGKVDVSYLGSEPQLFQVPPLNLQKMNFERTQRELLELEKEIKAGIDFSDVTHVNATTEQDLLVEISCGNILESVKFATNLRQPVDEAKMILINVALQANAHLESIQIQFHVENPLKCSKELTSIESLDAGQKSLVDSWIFVDRNFDPASTFVTTIVSFINRQSVPRIIEKKSPLPLAMFYRPHQGQKDVDDKFTISVENVSTPTILDLFENDFSIETMTMNAIGFRSIYSGKIVTIVSGKNSNRFRLVIYAHKKPFLFLPVSRLPQNSVGFVGINCTSHGSVYRTIATIRQEIRRQIEDLNCRHAAVADRKFGQVDRCTFRCIRRATRDKSKMHFVPTPLH